MYSPHDCIPTMDAQDELDVKFTDKFWDHRDLIQMNVYRFFGCRNQQSFKMIWELLRDAHDDDTYTWMDFCNKLNFTTKDIYAFFEFEKAYKDLLKEEHDYKIESSFDHDDY